MSAAEIFCVAEGEQGPASKTTTLLALSTDQWRPYYWTATASQATAPVAALLALEIQRLQVHRGKLQPHLKLVRVHPLISECLSSFSDPLPEQLRRASSWNRVPDAKYLKHHGIQELVALEFPFEAQTAAQELSRRTSTAYSMGPFPFFQARLRVHGARSSATFR